MFRALRRCPAYYPPIDLDDHVIAPIKTCSEKLGHTVCSKQRGDLGDIQVGGDESASMREMVEQTTG